MSASEKQQVQMDELQSVSRRDFLGLAAVWAAVVSMGLSLIGLIKFPLPALFPDISKTFKIGKPDDYPVGAEKIFEDKKVIVLRDQEGFYAISLICTHLGCIVAKHTEKYDCPCHGSKFDLKGKVKSGPAPKALQWLKIFKLPDGKLAVNAMKQVSTGTKFVI
jgi:cytochrome b6-f complex iron-sulfur subunit